MGLFTRRPKPSEDVDERPEDHAAKASGCPQCGASKKKAIEASPLGASAHRQRICSVCAYEYPKEATR